MSALARNERSPGETIPDRAVENLLAFCVFAVAWMTASVFIVTPMVFDALKKHDYPQLDVLAFPAIGLGLLLWASRRGLRIRKFGDSVLRLNPGPATPGGELNATIHVVRSIPCDQPMRLRLECIQRQRKSGTKGNTKETVLWQESQNLNNLPRSVDGTDIPVQFRIPADAQTTSGFDWNHEILWRLEARGKSGFVNYFGRFEAPVRPAGFKEAKPEAPVQAPVRTATGPDPRARLREPGITCDSLDDGGVHIHLAPDRRNPTVPTVFALIVTGVALALFFAPVSGAERIVTIALGAVVLLPAVLIDYIAIYLWFVSQDVKVHRGSLVMESRLFFFHWGKVFATREIDQITCLEDGASSSSSGGATTFHGIKLIGRDGKSTWLASNITRGDYAAWLTDEINATLGEDSDG